jgi:hypothetical protein
LNMVHVHARTGETVSQEHPLALSLLIDEKNQKSS